MAEQESRAPRTPSGDRRDNDRRNQDRRRTDRRIPLPAWRRPWALVGYGVLVALLGVGLLSALEGDDDEAAIPPPLVSETVAPAEEAPVVASNLPPLAAYSAAEFEQLVLEGESLAGRHVLAELSCGQPSPVALSQVETVPSVVAALRTDDGRVPAAECKWGRGSEGRRGDFLLLVPPALSQEFSSAPLTTDDFVRRRRLTAEVEWVGRTDALALRTAGVLRDVVGPRAAANP